jgi:hypothetical protein
VAVNVSPDLLLRDVSARVDRVVMVVPAGRLRTTGATGGGGGRGSGAGGFGRVDGGVDGDGLYLGGVCLGLGVATLGGVAWGK